MEQQPTPPQIQPEIKTEPKPKNPFKIATIILTVAVLCLGASLTYVIINQNNNENIIKEQENVNDEDYLPTQNNPELPDNNNSEITDYSKDLAVRDVILSIKKEADIYMKSSMLFIKTWDESFPFYLPDNAKGGLFLNKSYGLYNFANLLNQEWQDLLLSDDLVSTITNTLGNLGFAPYGKMGEIMTSTPQYINNEIGIICNISGPSVPYALSCGHISWIDPDDIELSNKLSEAYKEKEGNYPIILSASINNIVNSSHKPYQRITASTGESAVLFYRVSPESGWVFFLETQNDLSCDGLSTDAKKALAGEKCYNSSGNPIEIRP